jgi:hypothetical protein
MVNANIPTCVNKKLGTTVLENHKIGFFLSFCPFIIMKWPKIQQRFPHEDIHNNSVNNSERLASSAQQKRNDYYTSTQWNTEQSFKMILLKTATHDKTDMFLGRNCKTWHCTYINGAVTSLLPTWATSNHQPHSVCSASPGYQMAISTWMCLALLQQISHIAAKLIPSLFIQQILIKC